jgi:hypothetical protein
MFDCLEAVWDLTFPRGIAPFLTKVVPFLMALVHVNGGDDLSGEALDTTVPKAPNGSLPADMILPQ